MVAVHTALADWGGSGQIPRAFPFVSPSRHLKDICLSFYAVFGTVFHSETFRLPTMRTDGQDPAEFRAGRMMTVSLVWYWQHIANTFAAGVEKKKLTKTVHF